ncbi:MAG: translation initiation factor IF-2 [Alphaproteobacteria bacterium]|nr:translation initiation factor IF-2 [Alphaproteobacteria bacterium]
MADPQDTTDTNDTDGDARAAAKLDKLGRFEGRRTVETGQVKQLFSHGRTKTVVVETKKRRGIGGALSSAPADPFKPQKPAPAAVQAPVSQTEPAPMTDPREPISDAERARRKEALKDALKSAEVAKKVSEVQAVEQALRQAQEAEIAAREAERKRKEQDEEQRKIKNSKTAVAEDDTRDIANRAAQRAVELEQRRTGHGPAEEPEEARPGRKVKPGATARPAPKAQEPARRQVKLTVSEATSEESEGRMRSVAAFRRRLGKERRAKIFAPGIPAQKVLREVVVPEAITVAELANRMAERSSEVIKALMKNGVMATINQTIDQDTAELIASEFGHKVKRVAAADVETGLGGTADAADPLAESRPPVVTIMGHVDHGKTSLLDALRETDVAAHEAGGITQHIGAYQVVTKAGKRITFLDTPGHEAFTAMRKRGAQVTDIVVLVVAADDGVQPQTIEALNHARAAKAPLIIAINKIDKPDANAMKVKTDLLKYEIVTESMGGETQAIEVSALKKIGLDKLEEAILLQAEVLDLRANPTRAAVGTVIEAKLDRGRGAVATVLVQRGTLKAGDICVAGTEIGRVRALSDHRGNSLQSAGPSMPVEVQGLGGVPLAGDGFVVVESEARAREVTEFRQAQLRDKRAVTGARGTLEQMFTKLKEGVAAEVPVLIKSDVQGSAEAIAAALEKLGTGEVSVRVMHAAVGGITESDVALAGSSGGLIIGFNVRANPQARDLAKRDAVDIRYYSIIYEIIEDVKALMSGKLRPTVTEHALGQAQVREVFTVSKVGKIAGCMVTQGIIKRGGKVRLLRDSVVVHEGSLSSLKRFKEDAREVREGFECGIGIEGFNDLKQGDVIECYEVQSVERTL